MPTYYWLTMGNPAIYNNLFIYRFWLDLKYLITSIIISASSVFTFIYIFFPFLIVICRGFYWLSLVTFRPETPLRGIPNQVRTLGLHSQAPRALVWLIATKYLEYIISICHFTLLICRDFYWLSLVNYRLETLHRSIPNQVQTLGPRSQAPRALVWLIATKYLVYIISICRFTLLICRDFY